MAQEIRSKGLAGAWLKPAQWSNQDREIPERSMPIAEEVRNDLRTVHHARPFHDGADMHLYRALANFQLRCDGLVRSEEHTSELPSPMRISSAFFCLKNTTENDIGIT